MSDTYTLYVGEEVKTVSLWVRRGGAEYPIYANTRGRTEWFTFDTDEFENVAQTPLSDLFVEWLAHFHRVRRGKMNRESMFLASDVSDDQPDEEPEWYEVEILNAMGNPSYTDEQRDLLKWAYEQVEE